MNTPETDSVMTLIMALGHEDWDVRKRAVLALVQAGQDAVPSLVEAFRGRGSVRVRQSAVDILGRIGSEAKAAVPALAEALKNDCYLGEFAAKALGMIGAEATAVIPALIEALGNEDSRTCKAAIYALAHIGPEAEAAIPALRELSRNYTSRNYGTVISPVLIALGEIGLAAMPTLIEAFGDEEEGIRDRAQFILVKQIGQAAVPALIEALGDENPDVRRTAATSLGSIRLGAKDILKVQANPAGIDVVEDKALRIKEPLDTFRRIGEICTERNDDRFSFKQMERLISLADTTCQDHITLVSEFFRDYFKKFEHTDLAEDDDKKADVNRKVIHRPGSGARPGICRPWGWRAWELTCRFLQRREAIEAAKRRHIRPKT